MVTSAACDKLQPYGKKTRRQPEQLVAVCSGDLALVFRPYCSLFAGSVIWLPNAGPTTSTPINEGRELRNYNEYDFHDIRLLLEQLK